MEDKKQPIPWDWIIEKHIETFGYSGTLIRALRLKSNYTRETLANLLHKRLSYIKKIEKTDRVGIKAAKELQIIFKNFTDDWRVFRDRPNISDITEQTITEPPNKDLPSTIKTINKIKRKK